MSKFFKKPFILPLIILIAVALVVLKIKSKSPIEHEKKGYPSKIVEVIHAKKIPFRARAVAYGHVEPSTILKSKAEVAGKISYIHPNLKKGGSLPKGTIVLRIEPTTFELSLEQSKAVYSSSQSSLKQLMVEENSTARSLKIAQKNLTVGKNELARLQTIFKKGLIGRSDVDNEEQKVLSLQQQVEDLKGKLAAYKSRKSSTQSQIKQSQAQLAQSQDTLGRTEVVLPFDARIGEVDIEEGEFVGVGNMLFEALGTKSVEIDAQLASSHFRPLLSSINNQAVNLQNPTMLQNILAKMGLKARVTLVGYDENYDHWLGELLRIGESVDTTRDTIGLVIKVNNPYLNIIPGKRPPLLRGMYTKIDIIAPPSHQIIIPRNALHQGRVYIAKDDNTLEIREIKVGHKQGELVVVKEGIVENEKIIITDVIPVINGLPLSLLWSEKEENLLAKKSLGDDLLYTKEEDTK